MSTGMVFLIAGVVWLAASIALLFFLGSVFSRGKNIYQCQDERAHIDFNFFQTQSAWTDDTRPGATTNPDPED